MLMKKWRGGGRGGEGGWEEVKAEEVGGAGRFEGGGGGEGRHG